ncbi:MAG: ABC transporter ATP-binding protein [Lachnospiraceae bacterium]|nr:ABC transporter ATP-binding protein [Lachnospiraceae bacterium]
MNDKYAIELEGVSKSYDDFQLKNINIKVPKGSIMGLIGENGSGKSTTIKLILNMVKCDEGKIKVFGKDCSDNPHLLMEDIGIVFDELYMSETINPLAINKIMKNVYKNWDSNVFCEYLKRFNIPKKKKIRDLSKGTRMKLGIAIALSHKAKLLIFDEATAGLDPVVRDDIIDICMDFTKDEEHSILMSSHIVSDLEKACDYIAFLHNGELIMCDEKDAIKDKYRIAKGSKEEIEHIDKSAIKGKKENAYGVYAMVETDSVPSTVHTENITIEDLFIYTIRGQRVLREKDLDGQDILEEGE